MHGITLEQDLANRIRWTGGFTWSPVSPVPTSGYMVGVRSVLVLDDPSLPLSPALFEQVVTELTADPTLFLGGWLDPDSGLVYYDLSVYIPDYYDAVRIGKDRGEKAIFALRQQQSIFLD